MEIIYINLDKRTDRRESIEKVLEGFSYRRLSATLHKYPFIGATLSHIRALQLAIQQNWESVLIMEDDMEWNDFEKNYPKLQDLMKNSFDVIVLGGILVSHNSETHKLFKCNSTGAYVVHRNYYQVLLSNFGEGYNRLHQELYPKSPIWGLKKLSRNDHLYRIDIYWQRLQERDNWFLIIPLTVVQRPGYSDIEKKNTDYQNIMKDINKYYLHK
jgi:GR25 family glycosyltransferase involved in LPS biosynthesis